MRRREDWRSVAVVIAALGVHALHLTLGVQPALLVTATVLAYLALVVNHNHRHVATFRSGRANSAFDLLLTMACGLPVSLMVPIHLRNHHRQRNGPGDYMRTSLVDRLPAPLRLICYPLAAWVSYAPHKRAELARCRQETPAVWRRIQAERLVLATTVAAGVAWRGGEALLILGLPWALAQYWVVNANFLQHQGCDPASDHHSRDMTGRLLNLTTFNGGYHLEHHDRPGLHWSLLPAAHAARSHALPRDLIEPSFPVLLWRLATGRIRAWRTA